MPKYTAEFINEVAERNDIYDVVSSYVTLGKKSGANYFGLCPFHNEKTGSFSVSPERRRYHCFGCGKGGGVINFIMEIENFSFPEAVEFLAKRAGMELPKTEEDPASRKRARMLALNKEAARFFYQQLSTPGGQNAKSYMVERRISSGTAKSFGLGYAPNEWNALRKNMHTLGYSDEELLAAGLIKQKDKETGTSYYDAFRNRLMFPVFDVSGNVIGFSGRDLGDFSPKYLNSKETMVFNKGRNLFGLNLAKKSKRDYFILVEGNIDVVSLHQAGFDSAVASLGTSLTPQQAGLMSRYKNRVIIAYDSDNAGQKATRKAIEIFEKLDVNVQVLSMDGAKDPDEYIKAHGAGAFQSLIDKADAQVDYRLKEIQSRYDLNIAEQKVQFIGEACRLIAALPNEVKRMVYAGRIAELAGISEDTILREIEKQRKKLIERAKTGGNGARISTPLSPGIPGVKYDNPETSKAEEGVISLLYRYPEYAKEKMLEDLSADDFRNEILRHTFSAVFELAQNDLPINPDVLSENLSNLEISNLINIINESENIHADSAVNDSMLKDYINKIKDRHQDIPLGDLAETLKNKGKAFKPNEQS